MGQSEHNFLEHFTYKGMKYREAINELDLRLAIDSKISGAFSGLYVYNYSELQTWKLVHYQNAAKQGWMMLVCIGKADES